ncbi:MAG: efflux RND transporter permease subunit [Pirellulales bacterium]|nr:efflux RND transporter permease subunit [Pirellulales bacterium]
MTIWDLCIKRPIFTAMLVSAPIVMGIASFNRLGVDLFPNVDLPVVVITTTLQGASVEEMETSITKPVEEIVNTISGIDELRSTTKEGLSQVTVQFVLEKNGDTAAQEVRDKISTILSQFPPGTDPPIIDKFDLDASPVATIAISGRRDQREVTEIAKKQVKEVLETVSGVGAVVMVGGRERAVNVIVDAWRLVAYGLSIEDVRQALVRQNLEMPGGRVDRGSQEVVLRTMGRVPSSSAFGELIIADRDGYPVRINDIARVEDTYAEPRGLSRLDGDTAVSLVVQKQSGTNTVEVVHAVKQRLEKVLETLPADINIEVIRDQSRFIETSIEELKFHLVLAAALVSLTILLFIRDWRTTVIASLAIPSSVVAAFVFMDWMGFTLNNITMLGLILAIGIVIDDAVVVHENIFRHMEEHGTDARTASSTATREIALAVVATTLSLLVIFVPIAFMSGRVGRFFNSFGFTVGFAVLMSMFISFTMTPMLCAHFLKLESGHHSSKGGFIWRAIDGFYGWILGWSLRHRWVIVLASVGLLAATPAIFANVGMDFVPRDDQSEFEISMTLPEGYSLERADKMLREIEARVAKLRGVTHQFTIIGDTTGRIAEGQGDVTQASIYVRLIDLRERDYTQFDVMHDARLVMADYPDIRGAVQDVQAFQGSGFRQVDIDLNLSGPDLAELQTMAEQITDWLRGTGHYVDVDTSLALRKPELRVEVDREKASDLGVPIETIAATLQVLVGGQIVSKYKEDDEQYDVWLRADLPYRRSRESIGAMTLPSPKVGLVELANLAKLVPAQGPSTIDRFGRRRQVVVVANLQGLALGDAVNEISQHMRTMDLPSGYSWEFIGRAKLLAESNSNFVVAFALSFLFMYMVLAAQFESFVHPITILLALPLTLPFALISLILLRTPMDIYAMFGIFMLFGIVKKNGILQIDYTNVLREKGLPRDAAILEANHTRLRPILMTTLMLVAAMVPIALGQGPGAAARASMAKVILGGQTLSLLLTLLITPVAYSLWDDLTRLVFRIAKRKNAASAEPAAAASLSSQETAAGPPPPVQD